jgi:plasmid stabilization system protein ParE
LRIRLSRRAERDLSAIADHVGASNPRAAGAIGRAIRASLDLIGLLPKVGRPQKDSDLRKRVVPRCG